jgi:cation/acetate symporter
LFGIYPPAFVGQVVAFAFGLAAASFFPAIVLGIFWKRVSMVPAVAGMLCGIGLSSYYIIGVVFLGMEKWTLGITSQGIDPQGIGTLGMLLNFAVTLILTPFFSPPSKRVTALVDKVREPEGWSPPVDIEAGPEH